MKWTPGYESDDVEDRRDESERPVGAGLNLPIWLFSRFGIPGLLVGAALLYFGGTLGGGAGSRSAAPARSADEKDLVHFVSFVLDDVQKHWRERMGPNYERARLVLFRNRTRSGCGVGQAAMGPFYCPQDQKVYIDLSFYQDLRRRFGAPGDFAQAYVIAHELGHHLQTLDGTSAQVHRAPRERQEGASGLSVRLELQADCYAGVWAHGAERRGLLEVGDLEEALRAAAAIGDDRIQQQAGGAVTPESWTHGSSAQRERWFRAGYEGGRVQACDTFAARSL